jgi:hypothetical protein
MRHSYCNLVKKTYTETNMTCSNISKWKEIIECVAEKGFCEDEE